MQRRIIFLICCITAFCLYSCNDNEHAEKEAKNYSAGDRKGADGTTLKNLEVSQKISELICQRWDNADDHAAIKVSDGGGGLEMPMRSLYFFNDGTVTKNAREKMEFGKWIFDEGTKTITLTLENGAKEIYKTGYISYDSLKLKKQGEEKLVDYIADGFVEKNLKDDPFYPANQQWRIKSSAVESDAAIHKRVKDCLHFYYLFYMDNHERNAPEISFYGLPGCFKWYAGGIHLQQEDKLEKSWFDIFYNKQNAATAYQLIDRMISKKYTWDKEEKSWVKQNAGVLKQMEAMIDSL